MFREQAENERFRSRRTVTADGKKLVLGVNIAGVDDDVSSCGAEMLGLVRSEFLYLSSQTLPDETLQFEAYRKILECNKGMTLIRTLDVGGDKELPALPLPPENNPFLGQRAIRLCLNREELFMTQLCALLRASVFGRLGILLPMIATLEELRRAKEYIERAKENLRLRGLEWNSDVKVGMMVEVPSAAVLADLFAKEVDFFSIGTNDLVQYTYAADRTNQQVSYLNSYYHPAALRLIYQIITAAREAGIPCGMCGEAAGDCRFAAFLLGAGLTEFSMSVTRILEMRRYLSLLDFKECEQIAKRAMLFTTRGEAEKYLNDFYEKVKRDGQ